MELVPGAMGSLLTKLGELVKEEYQLQKGVKEQVQSLLGELEIMHAALRMVAEVPREQLNPLVKLWVHDVKELSYDMEDIVDTFLVRVEDGREATPNPHMLRKLMKKMGNLFSKGKARHQIADAIQDINKQIQEVANRHGRYTVDNIVAMPATSTPIDRRLQALYREATELVGINGKRDQELIKMLSEGDDVPNKKLKIVSVVGFGGLGKSTLVRAVYDRIKGDFDCWAFVSVGRNPDVKKVFKDILLEQNCIDPSLMLDERQLIDKLRKFLENKRYLIIIDDIWDKELWEVIKCAFSNRNNLGSRLITTTRNVSVSKAYCSSSDNIIYKMEPLSDDDSQKLFYQRIFSDRNGCPRELEQVSRAILKKCGGVPLAIITVASLLASKMRDVMEWNIVMDSIGAGLEISPDVKDMRKILALSYYDLPCHLKACLLYLSVFPEDYEIGSAQLIWRWIAEGFVQPGKQRTSLFEVGESYLNELVNRSMIQPLYMDDFDGREPACRVHDMVLDLICALSSEENFVTILDGTEQSTSNSQSKIRRLSLQNSKVHETTPPISVSQTRSITIFPPAINLMPPLLSFDVLRVLDLEGCYLKESRYLTYVGNLGHLRYLGLRNTQVGELPVEIGKLRLLQTLDLTGAGIRELPSSVVGLRHLMRLHIGNYTRVPNGLGTLASLEELTVLWVGPSSAPDIAKELGHLTQLRMLQIEWYYGLCTRASLESLSNLRKIQSLYVRGGIEPMREGWVPPPCLRRFTVRKGHFSTLPTWINPSLHHLSDLHLLMDEVRWEDIQILGMLPALTHLFLSATSGLVHMPVERFVVGADAFPCLRRFEFRHLVPVPFMFPRGAMPRLQSYLFCFRASDIAANGSLDVDMGNLPSLERVDVRLRCRKANAAEVEEAEAALRHAANVHPNRPTIQIYVMPSIPESDDDDMDGFIRDGEESAALDGDGDEDGPEKSS